MSQLWVISLSMLGVIVLLFLVVVSTNAYMVLMEQRQARKNCKILMDKLEVTRVERRDHRIDLVKKKYGFNQGIAERCADKLMDLELALYKFMINALQEDSSALIYLKGPVEDIINSCCAVTAGMSAQQLPEVDTAALEKQHAAVVNKLKNENAELRELNSTLKAELETMKAESERVMKEYISMYSENDKTKS